MKKIRISGQTRNVIAVAHVRGYKVFVVKKVYFKAIDSYSKTEEISTAIKQLGMGCA